MAPEFEIVDTPPQPALAVHAVTPVEKLGEHVGRAYGQIMTHLAGLGQQPVGPPFVCYHTMDMAALDVEIGFPVAPGVAAGPGPVGLTEVAGGRRAVALHAGPYENLGDTYGALAAWVAEQGESLSGPTYEYYLNAPDEVATDQLLTRIEVLLG